MNPVVDLRERRISRNLGDVIHLCDQLGALVSAYPIEAFTSEQLTQVDELNSKLGVALLKLRRSRKRVAA
jgi:hypothetical protein